MRASVPTIHVFIPSAGVDFGGGIKFHSPMPLGFEWDEDKAGSNLAKHGVSFEEAATVFADLKFPRQGGQGRKLFVVVSFS